jgi:hypothetical protein
MNDATRYGWNRCQGWRNIPRPTRLGWTFLIGASILIASIRLAYSTARPASSLLSFQGPGAFTKRDSENLNTAVLLLSEIHPDVKTVKRLASTSLKMAKGELPMPKLED